MSGRSKNRGVTPAQKQAQAQAQLVAATWSAPVPPPGTIREYNDICPELGTQIIKNFNAEGEHRRAMEAEQMSQQRYGIETNRIIALAEQKQQRLIANVTLFLLVSALIFGGYLIIIGRSVEGWATIIGQIVLIIVGRTKKSGN